MINKPSEKTLISIWNEYIAIPSFQKRLVPENFIAAELPEELVNIEARRDLMREHSYKSIRPLLKELMHPKAYQSLGTAYRSFQYKKLHDLVNISVDQRAFNQLKGVMSKLGLDDHDSSFSDAIDWLSAPNVKAEEYTKEFYQISPEMAAKLLKRETLKIPNLITLAG